MSAGDDDPRLTHRRAYRREGRRLSDAPLAHSKLRPLAHSHVTGPSPTIGRRRQRKIECMDLVPVAPFQERFLHLRARGEMTVGTLCREMGWTRILTEEQARRERRQSCVQPDTSLAQRHLGLKGHSTSGVARAFIPYEMAERLCRVLGMDPHEAGI